jgi:hypothetical protein
VTWLDNGNLACTTCGAVFEYPGSQAAVLNAARAKGWHLFTGQSLTGKDLDNQLCEACIGSAKKKPVKGDVLDEDVPLFDVGGEAYRVVERNPRKDQKPHA